LSAASLASAVAGFQVLGFVQNNLQRPEPLFALGNTVLLGFRFQAINKSLTRKGRSAAQSIILPSPTSQPLSEPLAIGHRKDQSTPSL
jgi:hypothetical protein